MDFTKSALKRLLELITSEHGQSLRIFTEYDRQAVEEAIGQCDELHDLREKLRTVQSILGVKE